MNYGKSALAFAVLLLTSVGAGVIRFKINNSHSVVRGRSARTGVPSGSGPLQAPEVIGVDPDKVADKFANFLGNLTAGPTPNAAGQVRNYVVSYQVDFLRKTPNEKLPEEGRTYDQLREEDPEGLPPHIYYGETVVGEYDPAQPAVVAIRALIDGKEVSGFVDAAKLWIEPPLDAPRSDYYMAVKETVDVHVLPSLSSPAALTILQGEVVDAVGALDLQGMGWVKARFNVPDQPRYGFIAAGDLQALSVAAVDQSKVTLQEVPRRIRSSDLKLAASDRSQLARDGFYIEPISPNREFALRVDDMADDYQETSSGEQYFITTDLFLHAYHLIFDRMLQDMEEKRMLPAATKLSAMLARKTEAELNAAPASPPIYRNALLCDLLYFSVPAKVLDPKFTIPAAVRAEAETIVARVNAGSGELPSSQNFLGLEKEDFTQYKVRGHYAKNAAMQRYFRGMMWYGRRNFRLSDKTQTLAAILLPHLVSAADVDPLFYTLNVQVNGLVGPQDKYSLDGYEEVNEKVFHVRTPGWKEVSPNVDANLAVFQETAWKDLPHPRIVTEQSGIGMTQEQRVRASAGMQFLGQRFVLDAFILNQLTSPNVGTDQNPRNLPSALDVMMVLGSRAAADLQQEVLKEHQWANYDAQIAKLKELDEVKNLSRWGQDPHYGSLDRFRILFLSTGSKQMFMLGEPGQYKSLNTAAASWTELKHDTLLYAEQSEAEMGGGEEFHIPPYTPPPPKGYVEPNPRFFHQMTGSIDSMLLSMRGPDGLTDEYVDKFTTLRELADRAEAIAQEEVYGQSISPGDYEWIENVRLSFDAPLLLPRGSDEIKDPSQLQMALVADVATDAFNGRVLEEGIGTPQRIVVVVKDASGGTRLTVGYVYSYFEFASTKRWNDVEWKKTIYAGSAAERQQLGVTPPLWYAKFLRGAGGP